MYLVAMLDPDTPSFHNPLCRHWVHYIFGNVKVSLNYQSRIYKYTLHSVINTEHHIKVLFNSFI